MKFACPALAGLAVLALAQSARAVSPVVETEPPSNAVCRVENPRTPAVDWSGKASYRARGTVKEGHVVAVEVTGLTAGVDRRAQRALVFAISEALRGATCQPGEHEFVQTFSFDIPKAPATPASGAAG